MAPIQYTPMPADVVSILSIAAIDLQQQGLLMALAEDLSRKRGESNRDPSSAEQQINHRLSTENERPISAVRSTRSAAGTDPDAFNAAVAGTLGTPSIDDGTRASFRAGVGAEDGDFAAAALRACDRAEASMRSDYRTTAIDPERFPPVSGGEVSECDLIVLGGMLGGATCVVGCGPCCAVGVGGVIAYVSLCT